MPNKLSRFSTVHIMKHILYYVNRRLYLTFGSKRKVKKERFSDHIQNTNDSFQVDSEASNDRMR